VKSFIKKVNVNFYDNLAVYVDNKKGLKSAEYFNDDSQSS